MDGSQATVSVRPFRAGDERRWDQFVWAHADGTFFHLSGWKRVIERAFGHRTYYLIAERGPAVTGVLPLTHVKSLLFGSSLISNAFSVRGGPIAEDTETLRKLEAEAIRLMDAIAVPVLELRDFSAGRAGWPSNRDLYASFRRSLHPCIEDNLKSIPRKQRAMIRKGIRNKLRSEVDLGVERLYRVYAESVRNLGTPVFSKSYFRILREEFATCSDIVTVTCEGQAVASVLNFYFRDEVLPFYGAECAQHELSLLMISCIGRSCAERANEVAVILILDAARLAPGRSRSSAIGDFKPRRSSTNSVCPLGLECLI
jgi:FemAB-related protein (PEP-CTERM system-associated)